jgi:hypothetical protein
MFNRVVDTGMFLGADVAVLFNKASDCQIFQFIKYACCVAHSVHVIGILWFRNRQMLVMMRKMMN